MPPNFVKRVHKDIKEFIESPPEFSKAISFKEDDLNNIFFLFNGPDNSPYQEGEYIFQLILPKDYPVSPPDFVFLTPTGRFAINIKICTTFSSHHKETWSPCYNFVTLFRSIISFMLEESNGHIGGITTNNERKKKLAVDSVHFNKKNNLYQICGFQQD